MLTDAAGRTTEAAPGHISFDPPDGDGATLPPPAHGSAAAPPGAAPGARREVASGGITAGMIVVAVVAALIVAVVAQNTEDVKFELLWWDAVVPLAVVVLVAMFATFVVDELVGFVWRRRRRETVRLRRSARASRRGSDAPL